MMRPSTASTILLLTLVATARGQSPDAARLAGSITIRAEGREFVLTPAILATLPRREARIAAEGSGDSVTVSGVPLWDLLQKAGAPAAEASGRQRAAMFVRLTGADGQTAVFGLVEIDPSFSRRPALVVDRRNGRPLDAVEGAWRAIIPDDLRHARWIRGLVLIEVATLKP